MAHTINLTEADMADLGDGATINAMDEHGDEHIIAGQDFGRALLDALMNGEGEAVLYGDLLLTTEGLLMADRWWGALEIANAPAKWTRVEQLPSYDGGTYDEYVLDTSAMPEDLGDALEQLGFGRCAVERDDDTLRLSDDELSGGAFAFHEYSALDALKANGYAFRAWDDGDYGNPGVYYFWRPGLAEIEERTYAAETGIVIDAVGLKALFERAGFEPAAHPELARVLREHFDLAGDDTLLPERTEA